MVKKVEAPTILCSGLISAAGIIASSHFNEGPNVDKRAWESWTASSTMGLAEAPVIILVVQTHSGPTHIKHEAWISETAHLTAPDLKMQHVKQTTQLPLHFLKKYCTEKQKTHK